MQRTISIKTLNTTDLSSKLVNFARNFELACILDSHTEIEEFLNPVFQNEYDLIAGFSNIHNNLKTINSLEDLHFINPPEWFLGLITYDIKNQIENLSSNLPDQVQWPELFFFNPEILLLIKDESATFIYNNHRYPDFNPEMFFSNYQYAPDNYSDINFTSRISESEYIENVEDIKKLIFRGDIYEVNFCQEFYATCSIDPYNVYCSLTKDSPAPFSSFLKLKNKFLLSASPERFLKKKNNELITQPIKGTIRRSTDIEKDISLKDCLKTDLKERSENIMIVDLVRNDLSRIARRGTVKVDELCEVYSFPHVHQMISTVSAETNTNSIRDIIKATFPMGSMTGAPKIEAMKIIEKYESVKRGIYSGSVGYITPDGDFDFNVVIRSLQYNSENNYVSYLAGSAITSLSDPKKEYEECLLKTYGIKKAFKQPVHVQPIS